MAYLDTYTAYVRYTDGTESAWNGLRRTQAQWRYHWIRRNTNYKNEFQGKQFKEFGWKREFQA